MNELPSEVMYHMMEQLGRVAPIEVYADLMEHASLAKATHSVADSNTVKEGAGDGATEDAPPVRVGSDVVD